MNGSKKAEDDKKKLKKQRLMGLLVALGVIVLWCCGLATCWALISIPSTELQPTSTWAPVPTLIATSKPTPTPIPTKTSIPILTSTPKPTETPIPEPTKIPTATPTSIPKPTSTIMLLLSPTPIPTPFPPSPEPPPTTDFSAWYCPMTLEGAAYVGAVGSDKFHIPSCHHVRAILPENRICFASREAAIADNRVPCKHCNP